MGNVTCDAQFMQLNLIASERLSQMGNFKCVKYEKKNKNYT